MAQSVLHVNTCLNNLCCKSGRLVILWAISEAQLAFFEYGFIPSLCDIFTTTRHTKKEKLNHKNIDIKIFWVSQISFLAASHLPLFTTSCYLSWNYPLPFPEDVLFEKTPLLISIGTEIILNNLHILLVEWKRF